MDIIHLPACDDGTGSGAIVGSLFLLLIGVAGLNDIFRKFSLFDDSIRTVFSVLLGSILPAGLIYYSFWNPFTGVSVRDNTIQLHYNWPRQPLTIDATTINDVSVDTTLQLYMPARLWEHRLQIATDDRKTRDSNYVCMDRNKVGTDYQSAIFTKLNDPVERAEKAIFWTTVMSKLASPKSRSIKPDTYARMMVTLLRDQVYEATRKDATEADRQRAMARLNELLETTKRGLGDNHYAVSIVYRFIGSAYGHQGNLKQAKAMFERADAIRFRNFNEEWYAVDQRINPNGLSMFQFEHPEIGVRTPNSALFY